MKSSLVVIPTTLGKLIYMQISASINEESILLNIVKSMHDTVTEMMSIPMSTATPFQRSIWTLPDNCILARIYLFPFGVQS